jgi:hypothetical protein
MRVELRSTAEDRRPLEPAARSLLDSLVARFLRHGPSTLAALGLARDFSAALDHAVEPARTQFEQQLAGEKASYKDTTDGSWVEERDEFYEHMLRSEHLRQRAQLVQILISFLGDALRCHWTSEAPDLPEYREATQALAARSAPPELLHRIEALQTMRDHLSTTAFEALVMETGFLRAFG